MIKSFGNKATKKLFEDGEVPDQGCGWEDVADVAARKLDMVDAAEKVTDLWQPPGNNFKTLDDDWCQINVNKQWRIRFRWTDDGKEQVHICDPH